MGQSRKSKTARSPWVTVMTKTECYPLQKIQLGEYGVVFFNLILPWWVGLDPRLGRQCILPRWVGLDPDIEGVGSGGVSYRGG